MLKSETIYFYLQTKEYGCFSNYSEHHVDIYGVKWPTSEHAFQAMKYTNLKPGNAHMDITQFVLPHAKDHFARFLKTDSPAESKKLGGNRGVKMRDDWEDVKDRIMYEVVLAKFTQNAGPRKELLRTGNKKLVEHTKNDSYWADGGDGSGRNQLGITLMAVRDIIVAGVAPKPDDFA